MTERLIRQLFDDLDEKEINQGFGDRIEFSIQGTDYVIDLHPTNAEKLEAALRPYSIHDWANAQGFEVAPRGRVKADIIEAFDAAH